MTSEAIEWYNINQENLGNILGNASKKAKNPLENLLNRFQFVKSYSQLPEKQGIRIGTLDVNGDCLFLDHWKEKNSYYSQWCVEEINETPRNIGPINKGTTAINISNPKRESFLKDIAESNGIEEDDYNTFMKEFVELANFLGDKMFPHPKSNDEEELDIIKGLDDYSDDVKKEANTIFQDKPLNYYLDVLDKVHYGDKASKQILILANFSKYVKNGKPVNVIIVGSTESGKTSLANKTSKLFPDRFLIFTSSMSAKAAYYHHEKFREDYNHVVINDFLDSPEAIGTLKAMTDTEILNARHMTVSDDKKALELNIKGKNTIIITAAQQLTDKELNRRLLHLNPDESKKQQTESKNFILNNETSGSSLDDSIFETAKVVTELIIEDELEVFVPWMSLLDVTKFGKTDIILLSNLVKARTLIYRANRELIDENTLISTKEDMLEVLRLWHSISNMQKTYLPAKAFDLVEKLPLWDKDRFDKEGHYGKAIRDIKNEIGVSKAAIRRWIWGEEDQLGLVDLDYVHTEKDGTAITSQWIIYKSSKNGNTACSVNQSQMDKAYMNPSDQKTIIRSICTLYIIKGSYSVDEENFIEMVCNKFPEDIKTDGDILEICEFVQDELHSA